MWTESPVQGLELRGTHEAGAPFLARLRGFRRVNSLLCPQTDRCCLQRAVALGGVEISLRLL